MSRKPSLPSYAAMTLAPVAPEIPPAVPGTGGPAHDLQRRGEGGRTLKEASTHLMLYLHPDAAKALKRYAVDQNTKVHDLLLEAIEDWFHRHGLREPVKADTRRTRLTNDRDI